MDAATNYPPYLTWYCRTNYNNLHCVILLRSDEINYNNVTMSDLE